MSTARRMLLLFAAALATSCVGAPAAVGQAIEITDESTSEHCSANVSVNGHDVTGGCEVIVESEENEHVIYERHTIFGHVVGFSCPNTYQLNFDEDGNGYFSGQTFGNDEDSDCGDTVVPCDWDGNEAPPWDMTASETAAGIVTASVEFCFDSSLGQCAGDLDFPIVEEATSHLYESRLDDARVPGTACEITGHWVMTGGDSIEIAHL